MGTIEDGRDQYLAKHGDREAQVRVTAARAAARAAESAAREGRSKQTAAALARGAKAFEAEQFEEAEIESRDVLRLKTNRDKFADGAAAYSARRAGIGGQGA